MDSDGNVVWVKENPSLQYGQDSDYATSIAVDSRGFIYVAYSTTGVTSGETLTGSQDIVVLQLDNNGNTVGLIQQPSFQYTL